MKVDIFGGVLLLICIGCAPQRQGDQLTQQQKEQIKQELKGVCDTLWASWGRLDGDAGIEYLWDAPEFVAFNADGSQSDCQTVKKLMLEMAHSESALKLTPTREHFLVLARDIVVYTWFGKSEVFMKSGDKITYDPDAETFVFNKVGDQWKIVFIQESATVVTQKPGKK